MPVATTVTQISSSSLSSKTTPMTMLASAGTASLILLPIISISSPVMFSGPVILYRMALQVLRLTSSSRGLVMALFTASSALFSPLPLPMPIRAMPDSRMHVCTSAKSRLMSPERVITSEMPLTPSYKTSFALDSRSRKGVFLGANVLMRSLGMVIRQSTCLASSSMPACA